MQFMSILEKGRHKASRVGSIPGTEEIWRFFSMHLVWGKVPFLFEGEIHSCLREKYILVWGRNPFLFEGEIHSCLREKSIAESRSLLQSNLSNSTPLASPRFKSQSGIFRVERQAGGFCKRDWYCILLQLRSLPRHQVFEEGTTNGRKARYQPVLGNRIVGLLWVHPDPWYFCPLSGRTANEGGGWWLMKQRGHCLLFFFLTRQGRAE